MSFPSVYRLEIETQEESVMIDDNGNQKKKEVEFPGVIENAAPGTFICWPCPHCEGTVNFDSFYARQQHLKDYHKQNQPYDSSHNS